jgi:predicted nucleic acid-binding protein
VDRIYVALDNYPHVHWIQPSLEIAERAARIRADYNLKTPDAIQAATATVAGATALISNDPIFRRVSGFEVLLLDEML